MSLEDTNKLPITAESVDQSSLLFTQLEPQQVEEFYQHWQHWQRQQRAAALQEQIAVIDQHIVNNTILMQNAQPSPIALATLTSLQSYGVEDVDLLDTMLERGETWLDHTMQQLERCEQLDLIHDNYTEWCQLALEGAYDWLDSVNESTPTSEQPQEADPQEPTRDNATESLLLKKLMSEDDAEKTPITIPTQLSYTMQLASREALSSDSNVRVSIVIPSRLSYAINVQTIVAETQEETNKELAATTIPIPTRLSYTQQVSQPIASIEEPMQTPEVQSPPPPDTTDTQQKFAKRGIMSRIMDKVWQT